MKLNKKQIKKATELRHDKNIPVSDLATLTNCSISTIYKHTYKSMSELLAAGHKVEVMINGKVIKILQNN